LFGWNSEPARSHEITTPFDKRGVAVGLLSACSSSWPHLSLRNFHPAARWPAAAASVSVWIGTLARSFSLQSLKKSCSAVFAAAVERRMQFWKANLLQALLVYGHALAQLAVGERFPGRRVVHVHRVFAVGLLLGWLLKRTNSIWPPIVVHIVK